MTKRVADMTPEERETERAKERARRKIHNSRPEIKARKAEEYQRWVSKEGNRERLRESNRERYAEKKTDPEYMKRRRAQYRKYYYAHINIMQQKYRARWNNFKLRGKDKRPSLDLFTQLQKLCARDFNRDDILAEAFILVMEGLKPEEAVAKARRKANKFSNELRFNTVDIHDESKTFWLGEAADFDDSKDDI